MVYDGISGVWNRYRIIKICINMETWFDILLVGVLLSVCMMPIILTASFVVLRKMYNDWKKYISEL